jgi:isoleucyl-tRNA synthetase
LWNVYSFFVTYANLDKPEVKENFQPNNELDKWLLSTLNTLVCDVTKAYEEYDVPGATRPIEVFVENLSTWYLRRSRRRFWKSESDSDKQAAYNTLYTALVTLSKLLAPAMPFLAEEIYQNLVRTSDPNSAESVHLADWPTAHEYLINENLNSNMSLVMKMVSLGHSARQKANRKVRQPLAEVALSVRNADERKAIEAYAELISDELNVKHARLMDTSSEAVAFSLKPLPKQLGQKYGNRFPALAKAIKAMEAETAAKVLLAGEPFLIEDNGQKYEIFPDEVEVHAEAKEGFSVANEGAYMVALVIDLTPKLIEEGLAREFVRRVQDLRKQADFDIADRIDLYIVSSPGLQKAIKEFTDYISAETLAVNIEYELPPGEDHPFIDEFDGEKVSIVINRRTK